MVTRKSPTQMVPPTQTVPPTRKTSPTQMFPPTQMIPPSQKTPPSQNTPPSQKTLPTLVEFPCGICGEESEGETCIACDTCNSWFHLTCEGLRTSDFKFLTSKDLPYHCSKCTTRPDGKFDFQLSLQRLAVNRRDFKKLRDAAKLEKILLRNEPKFLYEDSVKVTFNNWALSRDETAASLLGKNWNGPVPVIAKGDGNCLYNSVSIAICGHEHYATELRLINVLM